MLKQALITLLFVFSASGGGHSEAFHHAFHGVSHDPEQVIGQVDPHDLADASEAGGDQHQDATTGDEHAPPSSGHKHSEACSFSHAHCCASAILTSGHAIANSVAAVPRLNWRSAVPYGRQTAPPLRPPRTQA